MLDYNTEMITLTHQVCSYRRKLGELSVYAFAEIYLQHHLVCEPSRMHEELFELLNEATFNRNERIAIAAPRGHAKSTIVSLAYVLWCVLYGHEDHVLLISATQEQAAQHLATIRDELASNQLLKADFPELNQPRGQGKPDTNRKNAISIAGRALVRSLGTNQGVRGLKHGKDRPGLIILDDVENHEQCISAEQRQKTLDWFQRTVLKAGHEKTNVIVVGTILHYDSLLARLTSTELGESKGVGWTKRIYRAVESFADRSDLWDRWQSIRFSEEVYKDRSGPDASDEFFEDHADQMLSGASVLWPEREGYLHLMKMRSDEGRLSFQAEKQNEPLDPDECIFSESSFRFWDEEFDSIDALLK
ncbi:MAG: hypothetical protein AAGB34_11265, partial [Planctomycetota bacterium]